MEKLKLEEEIESDLIAPEGRRKEIDPLLKKTIYNENEEEKEMRREDFEIAWKKRWQTEGELGCFQTRVNESPFSQYSSRGWEIHIAFKKGKEREIAGFLYENGLSFDVEAGYGTYFNCTEESGATIYIGSNDNMVEVAKIIEANVEKFLTDGAIVKVGDETVHMGSHSDIEIRPKITARFDVSKTEFGQIKGNKKYAEHGLPTWTELGGIPILTKYKEEVDDMVLISKWNKYDSYQKSSYYERLKQIYNESKNELIKDFGKEFLFGEKTEKKEGSDLTMPEDLQKEIKKPRYEEILNKETEKTDGALKITKETTIVKLENFLKKIKEKGRQKQEETPKITAENLLSAADKQTEKIEKEIKQEKSWIREKVEKAGDWYKKQPLKYKILFSLGCVGAASASAAVGGAVGLAIATAAFTGSFGQRALGGIATFVTVEGLLKKSSEEGLFFKRKEKRKRTKWEARRHTFEAAVLAALVGSGKFAEGIKNVAGEIKELLPDEIIKTIKENIKELIQLPDAPEVLKSSTEKIWLKGEEIVPDIKSEFLTIGGQGPEGTIIDYFKSNLETAKLFGWDGANLTEWAGKKAHLLWLEYAKEALAKPEITEQLKKLGYSADTEGYAKMMRRIGKGFIELNSKTGKINLAGLELLKKR